VEAMLRVAGGLWPEVESIAQTNRRGPPWGRCWVLSRANRSVDWGYKQALC